MKYTITDVEVGYFSIIFGLLKDSEGNVVLSSSLSMILEKVINEGLEVSNLLEINTFVMLQLLNEDGRNRDSAARYESQRYVGKCPDIHHLRVLMTLLGIKEYGYRLEAESISREDRGKLLAEMMRLDQEMGLYDTPKNKDNEGSEHSI